MASKNAINAIIRPTNMTKTETQQHRERDRDRQAERDRVGVEEEKRQTVLCAMKMSEAKNKLDECQTSWQQSQNPNLQGQTFCSSNNNRNSNNKCDK